MDCRVEMPIEHTVSYGLFTYPVPITIPQHSPDTTSPLEFPPNSPHITLRSPNSGPEPKSLDQKGFDT